jgi:AcrR family transcriptional regulator
MPSETNNSDRCSHLLSVAMRLFRDKGFHATGIDAILAESGVAKRTLYLHFRSKEALIVAVLVERDRQWREWFRHSVARHASSSRNKLLAVFDALEEWFKRPDFHGCMFINAAAEFPRVSDPIHREASRHKQLVREFVIGLIESTAVRDPVSLADGLCLLMEGAIVMAQITGESNHARQARHSAAILVGSELAGRSTKSRPRGGRKSE